MNFKGVIIDLFFIHVFTYNGTKEQIKMVQKNMFVEIYPIAKYRLL